jgi:hypothetical protein
MDNQRSLCTTLTKSTHLDTVLKDELVASTFPYSNHTILGLGFERKLPVGVDCMKR